MNKMILIFLIFLVTIIVGLFCYFFIGRAPVQKNITWGVNFSQMQAETLKLDWREAYLALFEDLGVTQVKLLPQWDWVEGTEGTYYFKDIDWQIQQAESHNAKLIYVLGMKTGRWPECHVPVWAQSLSKEEQQERILAYIKEVVLRYKNSQAILAWQAENEPLFHFGQCPWYDKEFLKQEVALIKSLDPGRQVLISDSGEQSLWLRAAAIGDKVGVTTYRKLWFGPPDMGFYATFPLPAVYYHRRAQLVRRLFKKQVIGVELQAEPWAYRPYVDVTLQEQLKTMNIKQFRENIEYARKTGFDTFYLWGVEWMYWLKNKQNQPDIWNEAKQIINSSI